MSSVGDIMKRPVLLVIAGLDPSGGAGLAADIQAATALGGGFWVLTPLDTGGFTVLVNRGFVPPERRGTTPPPI